MAAGAGARKKGVIEFLDNEADSIGSSRIAARSEAAHKRKAKDGAANSSKRHKAEHLVMQSQTKQKGTTLEEKINSGSEGRPTSQTFTRRRPAPAPQVNDVFSWMVGRFADSQKPSLAHTKPNGAPNATATASEKKRSSARLKNHEERSSEAGEPEV